MWPFYKRISLKDSGIFNDLTDWHSHILPGVDDGVQTMDEALDILRLYEGLGIKSVWLTPHIMEDMPNTTVQLRERFAELQAAYTGNVELHLAAEYMLDSLFEKRFNNNDLLPMGRNGDHLLVETSYFCPPMGLNNILLRIKAKGYYPVLAHPERYVYMGDSDYRQLKEMNIEFQINLPSLIGTYGKDALRKTCILLEKGWYNRPGTDLHSKTCLEVFLHSRLTLKEINRLKINLNIR